MTRTRCIRLQSRDGHRPSGVIRWTEEKENPVFLPTTTRELKALGWDRLDVILVTGDSYIDSPFMGAAVIGKVLVKAGFRVGIIAQPDVKSDADITRLGEPRLFWGITAGSVDSLVANRTASGKPRRQDDYTPGGKNGRRPDRASIVYSNLVRQYSRNTSPIVLGGIEASLRRVTHYDYWTDRVRRSVLFDAKADYLLYGMAERSVVELANALDKGAPVEQIRGLCYRASEKPADAEELPACEECISDKQAFTRMFREFYRNNDPVTGRRLAQKQDTRYLVQNPPAEYLNMSELDAVHNLEYERDLHPYYAAHGDARALETIRCSLATHRGCYGECSFCSIAVHQGRTVRWRSQASILKEAKAIAAHPKFKGTIQDTGGPTANMYGFECTRKLKEGACSDKSCLFPKVCAGLTVDHSHQLRLLRKLRKVPGVKRVVVASGVRYDMILADREHGEEYLREMVSHHVSGQMKIAPEHTADHVLETMGKPGSELLIRFKKLFDRLTRDAGKKQFLTYYLIAAHPGCTEQDMKQLKTFCSEELKTRPEQVQLFTPTPSTWSTLMYWTEQDPATGEPCFVEKSFKGRERQREIL